MVATVVGFIGVAAFLLLAIAVHSLWTAAIAVFMLMNCWGGLRHAQALSRIAKLPRRDGLACPACKSAPPVGDNWRCGNCRQAFDTFQTQAVCPYCAAHFRTTMCLECGAVNPMSDWALAATAAHASS
jgi:DNA-directed RNA polymerase subunit RPC12/RpoP